MIGVVALLVFGPKGLAEIAKQLGGTLRAFQPTIRELQEVSREFRETLEDEIGLDEIRNGAAPTPVKRQAPVEPVVRRRKVPLRRRRLWRPLLCRYPATSPPRREIRKRNMRIINM